MIDLTIDLAEAQSDNDSMVKANQKLQNVHMHCGTISCKQ